MKNSTVAILLAIPALAIAQEAPSDDATLIFKSRGDAMHVVFHTSASEQSCEGLTRAAGIYDAELLREKLLPFIAKLQQKANAAVDVLPEGKQIVKAGVPLQVFGQSKWSDKIGKSWSSGQCGPFTQQFTPPLCSVLLMQKKDNNEDAHNYGCWCKDNYQCFTKLDCPSKLAARCC